MISDILRSLNFEYATIKLIEQTINDVKIELNKEINDTKSCYSDLAKIEMKRIIKLIDRKNIYDLSISEIQLYIGQLITIIDFVMYSQQL